MLSPVSYLYKHCASSISSFSGSHWTLVMAKSTLDNDNDRSRVRTRSRQNLEVFEAKCM